VTALWPLFRKPARQEAIATTASISIQRAEMEGAAGDDGAGRAVGTEELRTGAIGFVPMRDVGHVKGASDDIIDLSAHDAADGRDAFSANLT